jgi:predicted RNase H-like nuclease (RuvC/YqgF family)
MLAAGHKPYINGTCDFASLKAMYGCIWWLVRVCVLGDDVMFAPDTRVDDAPSEVIEQFTTYENMVNSMSRQIVENRRSILNLTHDNEALQSKVREVEERFRSTDELRRENEELRVNNLKLVGNVEHLNRRLNEECERYDEDCTSWDRDIDRLNVRIATHKAMESNYERWLMERNSEIVVLKAENAKLMEVLKCKSDAWEGDDCFALSDSDECSDE